MARRLDAEDLLQFVGRRDRDLVEGAFAGGIVGAPASKGRGVAEAVALQVVERHLADQLGTQTDPAHVAIAGPAAGLTGRASAAKADVAVVDDVGGQGLDQLPLLRSLEAGRM